MYKFALILLLLPLSLLAQQKKGPGHIVAIGDPAPEFMLSFTDGSSKPLSAYKGKILMLQFTASWCSVCRKEMPFIESEIWQVYKDRGDFLVFAIDFKEGLKEINRLTAATGISYPVLMDPDGSVFEKYAEKDAGVTRNVLIGRNGKIEYLTRLFDREEFDKMKLKIADLLAR